MKTNVNIDGSLLRDAQKEAMKRGKTIEQVISSWAREGQKAWRDKHNTTATRRRQDNRSNSLRSSTRSSDWREVFE